MSLLWVIKPSHNFDWRPAENDLERVALDFLLLGPFVSQLGIATSQFAAVEVVAIVLTLLEVLYRSFLLFSSMGYFVSKLLRSLNPQAQAKSLKI